MNNPINIDTGTDELLARREGRLMIVTLNRPEARNALSDHLSPALRQMVKQAGDESDVGALLITGAGEAFCAGGDVKGMGGRAAPKQRSREEAIEDLINRQRTLTGAIAGLSIPTIAAIPGPAVGAGLAIALACDLRIMADAAFLATGYARIALTGDYGISYFLNHLVGPARAKELMFFNERINAQSALELGLANRVTAYDELAGAAIKWGQKLANGPAQALQTMKANVDAATDSNLDAALIREANGIVRAAQTENHKEAVQAFVEKRAPNFSNG
jgi:2-(1,2-epoxy-1,2-dihydrophenyl)acetyl-CoA isomerase